MKSSAALSSQRRNGTALTSRAGQSSSLGAAARRPQHDLGRERVWGQKGARVAWNAIDTGAMKKRDSVFTNLLSHPLFAFSNAAWLIQYGNGLTKWCICGFLWWSAHKLPAQPCVKGTISFRNCKRRAERKRPPEGGCRSTAPHSAKPSTTWASRHWCGNVGTAQLAGAQEDKKILKIVLVITK